MKIISFCLLALFTMSTFHAQILKKLGKKIQDDAEWRVRSKANQQVSKDTHLPSGNTDIRKRKRIHLI